MPWGRGLWGEATCTICCSGSTPKSDCPLVMWDIMWPVATGQCIYFYRLTFPSHFKWQYKTNCNVVFYEKLKLFGKESRSDFMCVKYILLWRPEKIPNCRVHCHWVSCWMDLPPVLQSKGMQIAVVVQSAWRYFEFSALTDTLPADCRIFHLLLCPIYVQIRPNLWPKLLFKNKKSTTIFEIGNLGSLLWESPKFHPFLVDRLPKDNISIPFQGAGGMVLVGRSEMLLCVTFPGVCHWHKQIFADSIVF